MRGWWSSTRWTSAARRRRSLTRTSLRLGAARSRRLARRLAKTASDGSALGARRPALVNAAGPWVEDVLRARGAQRASIASAWSRAAISSRRKFWDGEQAYLLQNSDKRVIFVNPYEGDFALIGTTDIPFEGNAEDVAHRRRTRSIISSPWSTAISSRSCSPATSSIPFRACGRCSTTKPPIPARSRATMSSMSTRRGGEAPMLSVFGGKITTYRKLAEHALEKLEPHFPKMGASWTAHATLPGGEIPNADFGPWFKEFRSAQFLAATKSRMAMRAVTVRARPNCSATPDPSPIWGVASAMAFMNSRLAISLRRNGRRRPRIYGCAEPSTPCI